MKRLKKILSISFLSVITIFSFAGFKQANASSNPTFDNMATVAKGKMGSPYSWGGIGPNVFDCSGFTQYIYKNGAGVNITRTAQQQYNSYAHVSKNAPQPGDLVFFGTSSKNITHVGMYLGNDQMIDAQNNGVVQEAVHSPWWGPLYVGASRPLSGANASSVSFVKYFNKKATKKVKKSNTHAIYNHVKGSPYVRRKVGSAKKYRGKKLTINKAAKQYNNGCYSKYYYRVKYKGKTIGWIYSTAF